MIDTQRVRGPMKTRRLRTHAVFDLNGIFDVDLDFADHVASWQLAVQQNVAVATCARAHTYHTAQGDKDKNKYRVVSKNNINSKIFKMLFSFFFYATRH